MFYEEKKNPIVMTWSKIGLGLGALQTNQDIFDDERYRHIVRRACVLDAIARLVYIVASRHWPMTAFLLQETAIRYMIRRGSRIDESFIAISSLVSVFITTLYVFPPLVPVLFGETAPSFAFCALVASLQWMYPTRTLVAVALVCHFTLGAIAVYYGGDRLNLIRLAYPFSLLLITILSHS